MFLEVDADADTEVLNVAIRVCEDMVSNEYTKFSIY
jgi:hypothetical protein